MTNGHVRTITVPEAGRLLGVGRDTAYRLVKEGKLPHLRLGKRIVVPLDAFDRFLASAEVAE